MDCTVAATHRLSFSNVCNTKERYSQKSPTPTLNSIAFSAQYASSVSVALRARINDQPRNMKTVT